jgi:hypothetical protein
MLNMKNSLFSLFFLATAFLGTLVIACKPAAPEAAAEAQEAGETFGAGVSNPDSTQPFSAVLAQLDNTDSIANVVLTAKVSEVCQAKGCWMNLVDPATGDSLNTLFVQFQDYGFFMPKDIAGREVVIEGVAYTEETSVEDLRHYAEDAGKSAEEIAAITEPVKEKKFMATGVLLKK